MSIETDAAAVAELCRATLDLSHASLGDKYYYNSLPLCFINSVIFNWSPLFLDAKQCQMFLFILQTKGI